jgi:hypothetical protein
MEDIKKTRFSRKNLSEEKKKSIEDLTKKVKGMTINELKKIPLYHSGIGLNNYKDGDLIRYSNGSILYIMINEKTKEKVPTLLTVIKDISNENSLDKESKNFISICENYFIKNNIQHPKTFFGMELFDNTIKIRKTKQNKDNTFEFSDSDTENKSL